MNREREQERFRLKNERRKANKKKNTLYAQQAKVLRKANGGKFGKTDPASYNKLAEGTTAVPRAQSQVIGEENHNGSST
jgi:hypothetical protein